MDTDELEVLQLKYAECVYANAISFHAASGEMWIKFFKRLRPKFKVPTREQLAGDLLVKSYDRVSKLAVAYVDKSDFISIVIDGWSNCWNDAIINVVAMTPAPIFFKSIDTKGATKSAKYMFDEVIEPIINQIGKDKVTGLISDNENKMLLLKTLVQAKYKHIVFNGCVAHKLSNMVKNICDINVIKDLIKKTEDIVKEINNHQSLHAKFRKLIEKSTGENKFGELKLYSKTRFAGTVLMINSVIKAISALRSICADPLNEVSDDTKKLVLGIDDGKNFVTNINGLHKILHPICIIIHLIESDNCSISDMIETPKRFDKIDVEGCNLFDRQTKEIISKIIKETLTSIKTPSALLSNVLHPLYRGKNLTPGEKSMAANYLIVIGKQREMDKNKLVQSYQQFVNDEHYFSTPFISSLDQKRPISWWKFVRNQSSHGSLCEIALRLLHIPPTNTSVERTFSRQKFIHRSERNRLSSEKVNMLMQIHCNLNRFGDDQNFNERNFVLESEPEIDDAELVAEDESEDENDETVVEEIVIVEEIVDENNVLNI